VNLKKLLSILCTLALVLSVVLIPGMFSASAAVEYAIPTFISATDNSVDGSCGPYTAKGDYSQGHLYFDIELEAGAKYAIAFDFNGENYGKFGVYAFAVSNPAKAQSPPVVKRTVVRYSPVKGNFTENFSISGNLHNRIKRTDHEQFLDLGLQIKKF